MVALSKCGSKEAAYVAVPKQTVILLSGIPATGKSKFARHLSRVHGFAHYDLEFYPGGWPHPELKRLWDTDRAAFVVQIRLNHNRVVLDWGFPISCLSWVDQLRDQNVRLIWFDGDVDRAREAFFQRGRIDVANFDKQVKEVQRASYPGSLNCLVIPALSASGVSLDQEQIESLVFH